MARHGDGARGGGVVPEVRADVFKCPLRVGGAEEDGVVRRFRRVPVASVFLRKEGGETEGAGDVRLRKGVELERSLFDAYDALVEAVRRATENPCACSSFRDEG